MGWFGGAGRRIHLSSRLGTFPGGLRGLPLTAAPLVRARSIPLPTRLAASPFGSDALGGTREREALARWIHGRQAARNRLPERVSGFKWNLRGTGTRHAAAIFQFFTPGVISAQSASFYL